MPILSAYGGQWKALCITQCVIMENKNFEGEDHVHLWWIILALLVLVHTLAATIDVWSVCLSSWHPTSTRLVVAKIVDERRRRVPTRRIPELKGSNHPWTK